MFGRPGPPLSRAISSRCAATVRRSSVPSSNSFGTKLFKSFGENHQGLQAAPFSQGI
jgi:hypothetical protein